MKITPSFLRRTPTFSLRKRKMPPANRSQATSVRGLWYSDVKGSKSTHRTCGKACCEEALFFTICSKERSRGTRVALPRAARLGLRFDFQTISGHSFRQCHLQLRGWEPAGMGKRHQDVKTLCQDLHSPPFPPNHHPCWHPKVFHRLLGTMPQMCAQHSAWCKQI